MKLCVDLEEEIEKGLEDGSISTSRANNLEAFCKGLEAIAKQMRIKGMGVGGKQPGLHINELQDVGGRPSGLRVSLYPRRESGSWPRIRY